MTKTKETIVDKESKNSEKKNWLSVANLVFSLFIICMPLEISIFHLVGLTFLNYDFLLIIYVFVYLMFLSLILSRNLRKIPIKELIKDPIIILIASLLLWMTLSAIATGTINTIFVTYLSFFCIVINFIILDSNYKKLVLDIFVGVISVCCIMGFIDPSSNFMPGFLKGSYDYSLQFYNPNHIGYVVVLTELLIVGLYLKESNIYKKVFYAVAYIIVGIYIFLNGSFAPITSIVLGLIIYFIYLWISQKKFPIEIFCIILVFFSLSVLVDIIPFLSDARFTKYGYLIECVAVFDNVFDTNLLELIMGEKIIVPGSDGWNRGELIVQSFILLGESFLFGKGCGFSNEFRPHNEILYLSLDFGVVAGLIYIALLVLLIIRSFKQKSTLRTILIISISCYYFSALFGNITTHSFIYLIAFVGLFMNQNKNALKD